MQKKKYSGHFGFLAKLLPNYLNFNWLLEQASEPQTKCLCLLVHSSIFSYKLLYCLIPYCPSHIFHIFQADPGWVVTDMTSGSGKKNIDEGADTLVWLAMRPEGDLEGRGEMYSDRKLNKVFLQSETKNISYTTQNKGCSVVTFCYCVYKWFHSVGYNLKFAELVSENYPFILNGF